MLGLRTKNGFNLEKCMIGLDTEFENKDFLKKINELLEEKLIIRKTMIFL